MSGSEPNKRFRIPPYAITRGRTKDNHGLRIESMVHRVDKAGVESLGHEKKAIIDLCSEPLSIAEVSAYLHLPLQVVKIVASDLLSDGYLSSGATNTSNERPDLQLLERVLDGLQSL